jgi:uncharacterized protein YjiS (DUF1127 family)
MLNSQSAIAAIRRYNTPGQAPLDRRDIPSEKATSTPEISKAEVISLPVKRPATAQADATWPPPFWFFLEGFALYGASLYGFATPPLTAITGEAGDRQQQKAAPSERQKSNAIVSAVVPAQITVLRREKAVEQTAFGTRLPPAKKHGLASKDVLAFPAREIVQYRFVRPGWLAILRRAVASRWAKWRQEREVRKAVAALAEYDDRTLRDMGILDRAHIEQRVRVGRDA